MFFFIFFCFSFFGKNYFFFLSEMFFNLKKDFELETKKTNPFFWEKNINFFEQGTRKHEKPPWYFLPDPQKLPLNFVFNIFLIIKTNLRHEQKEQKKSPFFLQNKSFFCKTKNYFLKTFWKENREGVWGKDIFEAFLWKNCGEGFIKKTQFFLSMKKNWAFFLIIFF